MSSQPHPLLSITNHFHRARAGVSSATQRWLSSVRLNRYHHAVVDALILLLRFGQVAATAILCLVFGCMVYEHYTHWCRWYPSDYWCRAKNPGKVPWSYWVVIATAFASFFQLYLLVLFRLRFTLLSRSSSPSVRPTLGRALSLLVSRTDIPILLLYIFAFASLSDYIVPSRILRGARSGTSCYVSNRYDRYEDVLLRECVVAQHGYWWCMGAMLSYLVTSVAGGLVWVEERVRTEGREGRKGLTITGNTPGPVALVEEGEDAVSLRETEGVE